MMKKLAAVLLCVCMLMCCMPVTVSAAVTWNSSTQTWTLDNGTLTISGTGSVYWIDSNNEMYQMKDEIERLVVEPGITEIGYDTFKELANLKQVTLPDGLTKINGGAFSGCTALEEINIPDSVTEFGRSSIWHCRSLTHIELPSSKRVLDDWFFYNCESLQSVTLPEGMTAIKENAFVGCSSLKELHIPGSVQTIDPKFLDYSSVDSIVYDGTRDQMVAAGIDPAKLSGVDFLFERDPVYTVTFDPNGGSVNVTSKEVRQYTHYGPLPVPAGGEGLTFLGWYTAREGGNLITASTEVDLSGDQILYARWSAGGSALTPAKAGQQPDKLDSSPNAGRHVYESWTDAVRSYLYENDKGGLTRVSCSYLDAWGHGEQKVLVEEYDRSYTLKGSLYPKMELPVWGGFFSGELYNFIIFGQNNPGHDDNLEVARVVRYDKNWNRIDHTSIYGTHGTDVTNPFDFGNVVCTERGGFLFIHTCRVMYNGHQSNWEISIDETSMQVVESSTPGYVSHSLGQFVLTDQEGGIVALDHGDSYPRCLRVRKYMAKDAGEGRLRSDGEPFDFQIFPASSPYTGASVGGFVETESGYLAAYDYDGDSVEAQGVRDRDVYYCYIDKESFTGTPVKLTSTKNASTPILAPMGLDGGYIMWNVWEDNACTDTLYYARYTADGRLGEVRQARARLSDCQPVLHDGKLVWYTTYKKPGSDEISMTFYSLDAGGNLAEVKTFGEKPTVSPSPAPTTTPTTKPTSSPKPVGGFKDVHEGDYFADAVVWAVEKDITSGTSETTFSPGAVCTREQIVTLLWRSAGRPKPTATENPFKDVRPDSYAYEAILWAVENNITSGTGADKFSPKTPCKRSEAVTFLWRANGWQDGAGSTFDDVPKDAFYAKAVSWAVENGITSGTSKTTFSPGALCTRAQIVTFMYRARN